MTTREFNTGENEVHSVQYASTMEGAREYFTGNVDYWTSDVQADARCRIDGTTITSTTGVEAMYGSLIAHAAMYHGLLAETSKNFVHNVLLQGLANGQMGAHVEEEDAYSVGLYNSVEPWAHLVEWDLNDLPMIGDQVTLYDRDTGEGVEWTVVGRRWHRGRTHVKDALHIYMRESFRS